MSTQHAKPNTHRVMEIVAAAGQPGVLAVDVADHFANDDQPLQRTQATVNILLSRAMYDGKLRRSTKRERPAPGSAHRSSFRWYVTPLGVEYLNPRPEPEIKPLPEPPNVRRILQLLVDAGEHGMTGPTVGRHFTLDYDNYVHLSHSDNLQRRLNWSNQILHRLLRRGYVERGGRESSPYYHNVPAFRWYITDKGREYLEGGLAAGRHARRVAAMRENVERNAERRRRAEKMITKAYVDYDPKTTPRCVRNDVIRGLRNAGCTLDAIGGVFDLTRERVRQIIAGISVGDCRCPKHDKEYSGVGWPS